MPAKKKTRASGIRRSLQLKQLKVAVRQLGSRLEWEAKARKLDVRLLAEAKKARAQVAAQMKVLHNQGLKLAAQLEGALSNANKREQARKEALAKIAELKAELARKVEEVRRKSGELKKLAQESVERAKVIVRSETAAAEEPSGEQAPPPSSEPPISGASEL